MPSLSLRFDQFDRPIVSVELKPGLAFQHAFQVNLPHQLPAVRVDFLVDTGATKCVVEEDVIASWGLPKAFPEIVASGAGPRVTGYRYPLSMTLREDGQPDAWHHPSWDVSTVGINHFGGDFRGIVGMDWLKRGSLAYSGPAASFVLSW